MPTRTLNRNAIKRARQRRGWTITEAAKRLGTTTSHLCAIEHGRRTPSAFLLVRMTLVYDCSLHELITEDSDHATN